MKKLMGMLVVMIFALMVSNLAWSAIPFPKTKGRHLPKAHHNPHKPGLASNEQPGLHPRDHKMNTNN